MLKTLLFFLSLQIFTSAYAVTHCTATVTEIRKDLRSNRLIIRLAKSLGPVQICDLDDDGAGGLTALQCLELHNYAQTSFATHRKIKLLFRENDKCENLLPKNSNVLTKGNIYSIGIDWW